MGVKVFMFLAVCLLVTFAQFSSCKSIEKIEDDSNSIKNTKRQTDVKKSNNETVKDINEETKNTIDNLTNTSPPNAKPKKDNVKATTASTEPDDNDEDSLTVQPLPKDIKKDKTKNQKKPIDNKLEKLGNRINPDEATAPVENDSNSALGNPSNFNSPNVNPAPLFPNGYNYPRPSGQNYVLTGGSVGPGFAGSFASASASAGAGGTGTGIFTSFSGPQGDKNPSFIGIRGSFGGEDNKTSTKTGNVDPLGTAGYLGNNYGYTGQNYALNGGGFSSVSSYPYQNSLPYNQFPNYNQFPQYNPQPQYPSFNNVPDINAMQQYFQNQLAYQQQLIKQQIAAANAQNSQFYRPNPYPQGSIASSNIALGPTGGYQSGFISPVSPGIVSRFGDELPPPSGGNVGVFSSSSSGSRVGPDGKVQSFKTATTGLNDNGRLSIKTVHDP